MKAEILQATFTQEHVGKRTDRALADLFTNFSRSFLQESIRRGWIVINEKIPRPRDKVMGGERIVFTIRKDASDTNDEWSAPAQLIHVIHEDDDLLVIDKAAGQVVHPAIGHSKDTLVHALIYHCPELSQLPRAGIVHRLDKDTTGLLVVAKTRTAHQYLVRRMQMRQIRREYLCLVHGEVIADDRIETNIGRHPKDRKRMAVVSHGRTAITHYRVVAGFKGYTLLRVRLETGRTHQVRVHMAFIRHPVFGDPVYGKRKPSRTGTKSSATILKDFNRQALHACELELLHPTTRQPCMWHSALPQDMQAVLDALAVIGR